MYYQRAYDCYRGEESQERGITDEGRVELGRGEEDEGKGVIGRGEGGRGKRRSRRGDGEVEEDS